MARARHGFDQELAIITSQLRDDERMSQVGEGARRVETRRDSVRLKEEKMKRDRQVQWLSRVRGVGLLHRGRFFA